MTTTRAWSDPELGEAQGLGDDRPRGGAEVKTELDPGLAVVRYLYDNSRIDQGWAVLEDRGFTWWGSDLAQRVWSEPGLDDDGIEIFRVFARTALLKEVSDVPRATQGVDGLNAMSVGSALVVDPGARTVSSIASMWVHQDTAGWVSSTFSVIAAIQVAQAHEQASALAPLLTGEPASSGHPDSGVRTEADEMLGLLAVVGADGEGPSLWAGDEMVETLRQLRQLPIVTLATGDETGISLELPYRQTTTLIQLDTNEPHPALGNGLLVRISLPGDRGPGPDWASMRNHQELDSLTRSHFLGSWVGSARFPTFVSFYPNLTARTGMGSLNIAFSTINRAMWVASLGRTEG